MLSSPAYVRPTVTPFSLAASSHTAHSTHTHTRTHPNREEAGRPVHPERLRQLCGDGHARDEGGGAQAGGRVEGGGGRGVGHRRDARVGGGARAVYRIEIGRSALSRHTSFSRFCGLLSSSRPSALPLPRCSYVAGLTRSPDWARENRAPRTQNKHAPPHTDVSAVAPLWPRMRLHRPPPRPSMRAGVSLTGRVRTVGVVPAWARVR